MPQVPQADLPEDLQRRKQEAEVAKVVAEAAKAEADAAKARADAAKADADAAKARADAVKTEQEATDHDSTAAKKERDATADKAAAEAERDAAAARRASITALVPDVSKVAKSTLTVKDGPNLGASLLTFGALRDLAEQVAARLVPDPQAPGDTRVLMTSQEDLATSDAVYFEVSNGLTQLRNAATDLLPKTDPKAAELQPMGPALALDLAAGLAAAVPAIFSLFSAERTLSTATVTVGNLAAAAEVAGAIKTRAPSWAIVHDDFRLLKDGPIHKLEREVAECREKLIARRLELARHKSEAASELDRAGAAARALENEAAKAGADPPADLLKRLTQARDEVRQTTEKATRMSSLADAVESAVASIDTFMTAIHTTPTGGRRPPIATAALHEDLHSENRFTHALLVRTEAGESQQLLENKPLWWNDKYSSVVDLSLTYLLISVTDSSITAAGTVTGTASASGKIGEPPKIKIDTREGRG